MHKWRGGRVEQLGIVLYMCIGVSYSRTTYVLIKMSLFHWIVYLVNLSAGMAGTYIMHNAHAKIIFDFISMKWCIISDRIYGSQQWLFKCGTQKRYHLIYHFSHYFPFFFFFNLVQVQISPNEWEPFSSVCINFTGYLRISNDNIREACIMVEYIAVF